MHPTLEREIYAKFSKIVKEGVHLKDHDLDGRIILKWILNKLCMKWMRWVRIVNTDLCAP
jgi:hypothetical protein